MKLFCLSETCSGPLAPGPLAPSFSGPLAPSFSGPLAPSFSGPLTPSFSGPLAPSFSGPLAPSFSGPLTPSPLRSLVPSSPRPLIPLLFASLALLTGCTTTEHATEADKAAAAQTAAARQQQADEAVAASKGIQAAEAHLAQLPPPAKGRYLQVHTSEAWNNPFLVVSRKSITLRIAFPANLEKLPNNVLPQQKLTPAGPNKREITLRLIDLPEALAALGEESWPYGRVVAVEEDPATPRKERPQMRRNVEAVMAMLNDLDVVADEWPSNAR